MKKKLINLSQTQEKKGEDSIKLEMKKVKSQLTL